MTIELGCIALVGGLLLIAWWWSLPTQPPRGSTVVLLLLVLPFVGCGPAAQQTQALAANSVAVAANTALPMLVEVYDQEGRIEIAKSDSRAEAEYRLERVRERWRPIWEGYDAFVAAHGVWATAIEAGTVSPAVASEVREAYCALRRAAAESVALPDYPLVTCGGGP